MADKTLETWKRIFSYSFSGPMVGKEEGEFLTWDELESSEQVAYQNEEEYNNIVNFCKK